MNTIRTAIGILLGALACHGCNFAPRYERPGAPIPRTWPAGAAYQVATLDNDAPPAATLAWQQFFTDPRLREVIAVGLANNRDFRLAALNVERARALYGIQRAELLPGFDAAIGGSRERIFANFGSNEMRATVDRYNAQVVMASWELDFFGRVRNLATAALEQYFATEQARRSAQIALVSSIARAYLTLGADRENLKIAQTTLDAQRGTLDLVKRRFERGLVPELDVHRARTQVDTARGDVARFTQIVAQDQNALNLLVGQPVPAELLPADLGHLSPPRPISAGITSDVLLERPDVLQAENVLRASYANVGAARAAYFPRISLTASGGVASSDLSDLFNSGAGTWSFGPQIAIPIFDPRTWAARQVSEADQKIALVRYERAIQESFREVADALAVHGTVNEQLAAQESLVNSVGETYRLSNSRYDKGVDSYLSVLDAQRSLYAAQQGLVQLRLAKLVNQVTLYAVLGGGAPPKPTTRPAKP